MKCLVEKAMPFAMGPLIMLSEKPLNPPLIRPSCLSISKKVRTKPAQPGVLVELVGLSETKEPETCIFRFATSIGYETAQRPATELAEEPCESARTEVQKVEALFEPGFVGFFEQLVDAEADAFVHNGP